MTSAGYCEHELWENAHHIHTNFEKNQNQNPCILTEDVDALIVLCRCDALRGCIVIRCTQADFGFEMIGCAKNADLFDDLKLVNAEEEPNNAATIPLYFVDVGDVSKKIIC